MQLPVASTLLVQAIAPQASGPASGQPDAQQQEVGDGRREQIVALLDDIKAADTQGLFDITGAAEWGLELAGTVRWAETVPSYFIVRTMPAQLPSHSVAAWILPAMTGMHGCIYSCRPAFGHSLPLEPLSCFVTLHGKQSWLICCHKRHRVWWAAWSGHVTAAAGQVLTFCYGWGADGRQPCPCRALEQSVQSPTCSLRSFAEGFRGVCEAAILHSVAVDSHRAQALSLVLDYGNQRITALERSSGASTSAPAPVQQQQQAPAMPEDPFWATADMPDLSAMLSLQVGGVPRQGHAYFPAVVHCEQEPGWT